MKKFTKLTCLSLLFLSFTNFALLAQVDPPMLQVEDQDADVADFTSSTTTTRININSSASLLNGSVKRAFLETDVDRLRLGLSSNNLNGSIRFSSWLGGSQQDNMMIASDGNVGIGTLSSTSRLHVRGSNDTPLRLDAIGSNNYIRYYVNSNSYKGYSGIYTGNGSTINDMQFGTGGGNAGGKTILVCNAQPKLSVDASGNVEINQTYTLPNADGAAGEVLTTDGAGDVSWGPAGSGSESGFTAYLDGSLTVNPNTFAYVTTYVEEYDIDGDFNPTTGFFIAPSDGLYSFSIKAPFKYSGTPQSGSVQVHLEPYDRYQSWFQTIGSNHNTISHTTLVYLTAGSQVQLSLFHTAGQPLEFFGVSSNRGRLKLTCHKVY